MDDMQTQMNEILNNPQMMQQIMAMAQQMNQSQSKKQEPEPTQSAPEQAFPDMDMSMIQKLAGFAGQSNVDKNQKTLLKALTPYLSRDRINKLERAMRAAKMANMASAFLGTSGFPFQAGR